MKRLCQYSDMFGVPGKGLHQYRIFNIAIVDVLLSILLAYIIYYLLNHFDYKIRFTPVLIAIFLLGIFLHWLFCVRTTIDKLLFPSK